MADNIKDFTLEDILTKGGLVKDPSQRDYAVGLVRDTLKYMDENETETEDIISYVSEGIVGCDQKLSQQMDAILHNDDYQELEGTWRSFGYFVKNTETSQRLKIRVFYASREEVQKDLEKAVDFDQSYLFKMVYEQEYGTFGGHPYSCLIASYEFGRTPMDISLLKKFSQVAAAAHAPMIASACPKLFDLEQYSELPLPRDLAKIFESTEVAAWNTFRDSEDSRYVALVLPHYLSRLPYGPKTSPVAGFNYEENVLGSKNNDFTWGNSAFVFGQRISNAAAIYNWTTAVRGVEGGGLVEGLPAFNFISEDGDITLKCPTEVVITDRREKELSDLGFIGFCHCKGTDKAAFFGAQTTQKPKIYDEEDASANAQLSARITYIMATSRFAHYLKVIVRDKIGGFMSQSEMHLFLNKWISKYVLLTDNAPQEVKAKFPLREARVDVAPVPGKPGSYQAVVYLRPHFQLEEIGISLRLVAKLPESVAVEELAEEAAEAE